MHVDEIEEAAALLYKGWCPMCEARLMKRGYLERRKGTSKNYNSYDFVGCSNYPECDFSVHYREYQP